MKLAPSSEASVMIIGSFDGGNAGDTAILWEIMSQLNGSLPCRPRYLIPTANPRFIESYYSAFDCEPLLLTVNPRRGYFRLLGPSTLSALHRSDLILTTAGIFFDYKLFDFRFGFVASLLPLLTVAARRHVPIVGYGIGVVPPTRCIGRWILRHALNLHNRIYLRDHQVESMLHDWHLRSEVCLGADAVLTMRSVTREEVSTLLAMCLVDSAHPMLAVNVTGHFDSFAETKSGLSRHEFEECIAKVISHAREALNARVVLVCTAIGDEQIARCIAMRVGCQVPILSPAFLSHMELAGVLGQAELVVGMRMHACLFAAVGGTPVVSLNYSPKVKNLMDMLGLGRSSLDMVEISEERLKALVTDSWKRRREMALLVRSNISRLVEMGHAQATAVTHFLIRHKNGD